MQIMTTYIGRWRRYYLAMWELSRLTDRELADLGIQRWDIPRVAYDTASF